MIKRKLIDGYQFVTYSKQSYAEDEMIRRSSTFYELMDERRSVRSFSSQPVDRQIIDNILMTASTAPSGAHKQPWCFCVVEDPRIKSEIKMAAEAEEYESYNGRLPPEWLEDLRPLQTDWHKDFLETAPLLIVVFKKSYELNGEGRKKNTYYAVESCGVACGFLLAAIHNAGLVALTHTPSPMNFLSRILNRPENEKPFLVIPVGYPAEECWVPDLERKKLEEVVVRY